MKINYHIHDEIYKARKSDGHTGWANPEQVEEHYLILEDALKHERFPLSGKVLEIGCGSGENCIWLAQRNFEVYGIDISPAAIEWAREKSTEQKVQINYRVGNVLQLADYYDNEFFDAVFDGHCLHCIIGEDRPVVLSNIFSILKSGGILHICSMCGDIEDKALLEDFDSGTRCLMRKDIAFRYIGEPQSILNEIRKSGFEILSWSLSPKKNIHEMDDLLVFAQKP